MKDKLVKLKSEICGALSLDLSNSEKQKLGELFTLVDVLILDKLSKITPKDYNSLYKDLMGKIVKNPNNEDARLLLDRYKHMDESQEGYVFMKLLHTKLMLQGYKNMLRIVDVIDEINHTTGEVDV